MLKASALAQILRKKREQNGALNLYGSEAKFNLDVEGNPIEVTQETSDIAHQLIEEFMLLANREVAAWLSERVPGVVYRIHGEPDESAALFCRNPYRLWPAGYGGGRSPSTATGPQTPRARTTCLATGAQFLAAALFSKSHLRRGKCRALRPGLLPLLPFLTSPIRRYPDLIDHRLVKFALGLKDYQDVEIRPDFLDALAKRSSFLERRAQDAERELDGIKAARYLQYAPWR